MDFKELEIAGATLARGLESLCPSTHLEWLELENKARKLALNSAQNDINSRVHNPELQSAARVLDDMARFGVSGGQRMRESGTFAAAAFAAGGNFPTATVVVKRTFPRLNKRDSSTATLLSVLAPSLCGLWKKESFFAATLQRFLRGSNSVDEVLAAWNKDIVDERYTDVWPLASAALEAILANATHSVLREFKWPEGFLARLSRQIPVLLPPQIEAIRAGLLNKGNALIALPPGTGKTLLGELFLASRLRNETGIGVFVVPYVALGRGVAETLREHLPPQIELRVLLGGLGVESPISTDKAQVWVVTPERLDGMLRSNRQLLTQIRAVVFDEAHMIGEGARGARIEGLISRLLLQQQAGANLEIALLSAALDELSGLSEWIEAKTVFSSGWTPTARRLASWRQDGIIEWHAQLSNGETVPIGHERQRWPQMIPTAFTWVKVKRYEPCVWQNVATLAKRLHEERGGAILCLCSTRGATRNLGTVLASQFESVEPTGARSQAIALIEERHRTLLPLADLLRRGVTWHNSSLPIEVRQLIEKAVREGEIAVVAATSTLAEGVDLPFAQTILVDWIKFADGPNGKLTQIPMSSALFRNIAGRCGRAGAFTEGETIVFDNPLGAEKWTELSARRKWKDDAFVGRLEETTSSYGLDSNLLSIFEAQLLAAKAENAGKATAELSEVFFAAHSEKNREAWAESVQVFILNWERSGLMCDDRLSPKGLAFSSLNWSSAACRKLLGTLETLPSLSVNSVQSAAKLNAYLWWALRGVPEVGSEITRFFSPRSRMVATPDELERVSTLWLQGAAPEAIFAAMPRAKQLEGLEQWLENEEREPEEKIANPAWSNEFDRFLDFMRAGLEVWTPALWRAAATLAPLAGETAQKIDWYCWAERFEAGVDSQWAVLALQFQAQGGRSAVAALGRVWPFQTCDLALDPLSLAPLGEKRRQKQNLLLAQNSVDCALQSVGGPYCYAGRNMLVLRDWIWARAGLTK